MKMLYYARLFCFIFLVVGFKSLSAQDKIHLKDGTYIIVTIQSVDYDVVRYADFPDTGINYTISKLLISSIDKRQEKEENTFKQQLKLDFTAISYGALTLGYERAINSGSSWEAVMGIDLFDEEKSFELAGEYKFYLRRASFKKAIESDQFSGPYVFGHVSFAIQKHQSFIRTPFTFEQGLRTDKALFAGLGVGRQWQYDRFSLDVSCAFLYFTGTTKITIDGLTSSSEPIKNFSRRGVEGGSQSIDNFGFYPKLKFGYQF